MTKVYQHVLLALDLSANALKLLDKTMALAKCLQAELTVLHAIEPSLSAEHVYVDETEYKKLILQGAKDKAKELGLFKKINEGNLYIEFGSVKNIILAAAKRLACDLIVVGSHGQHGMQVILGGTANTVLHGATQDVLVIRYEE